MHDSKGSKLINLICQKSTPSNYAHAITFKEAEWEYFYTMHEEVAQRLMKLVNLGLKLLHGNEYIQSLINYPHSSI